MRIIIAGPPLAGKSTYAREQAAPGDLIYDYDLIHQALSGLENHDHRDEIRPYVIAARESIFEQLEAHSSQSAFVITSSPKRAEIEQLSQRFGAEIVFLQVDQEEAHRRADLDHRPEKWHTFIENWFKNTDIEPGEWSQGMKKKTYKAAFQILEDGEPGDVKAVFATFNVKDLDGDVTIPGAFHEGQEVVIEPWNHGYTLPAGKGVIKQNESEAWIDGRFFLTTEAGRENYQTVKEMGSLAEWSYTFDILEGFSGDFEGDRANFLKDLDTIGVSPVTRGAGIDTHTIGIKNQKQVIRSHSTPTTDQAWDGPEIVSRVKSDQDLAYYSLIFAWRDPEGDQGVKSSYKFPHHEVSAEGDPGAANLKACQAAIGSLNGARGGASIPEGDRAGVYNHLAKHLRDADLEAPDLKSIADLESSKSESESDSRKLRAKYNSMIDLIELTYKVNNSEVLK